MNGIHDLGGMHGFGPVVREEHEPVFHSDWERRVFAIVAAMSAGRVHNTDEFRHAIERMNPARYLATSYYERWLNAIETLLVEKGILRREDLPAGAAEALPAVAPPSRPSRPKRERRARFKRGDRIIARNLNPVGHTRLPGYVRGRPGVVVRDLGVFVLPDTNAHGLGRDRRHCYTVAFKARDLWGPQGHARDRVYIDLWEDYLEAAAKPPKRQTSQSASPRKTAGG